MGPIKGTYRPGLIPEEDIAASFFEELAKDLGDVDIILFETVCSVNHARGALKGALSTNKPVWLAITISDETEGILRSGEDISLLKDTIEEFKPEAILINCSVPEVIEAGLKKIAGFGIPFGAYANGFNIISDSLCQND